MYIVENQQIGFISMFRIDGTNGYMVNTTTINNIRYWCIRLSMLLTNTLRNGIKSHHTIYDDVKLSVCTLRNGKNMYISFGVNSTLPVAINTALIIIPYVITHRYSFKNFRNVILDVHMKYPVIIRKQLIPVFPHMPNRNRYIALAANGADLIGPPTDNNPELTTKWWATIANIQIILYSSKSEDRFVPPPLVFCYSASYTNSPFFYSYLLSYISE